MPSRHQRVEPSSDQLARAVALFAEIPILSRREWSSASAQSFLDYVAKLQHEGVPVAWLAEHLKVPATVLYAQLDKHESHVR